ncbi:Addiction module toxin, RelE/StbE family (fragment) [Candidatus Desulfosporosinus infrequens]|uniref:Addiction module toxin, RelE/StbE family n=1 Tax=Candidatus Desulfosporosinus infrequens TaxID=2043169 RepID=A0A2U3L1M5_9FIRM
MVVKIRVNPVVAADLQEIKDYIALDNPDAAQKTVKEIVSKIEGLLEFPEIGTLLAPKIKLKSKYRYLISGAYYVFVSVKPTVSTNHFIGMR